MSPSCSSIISGFYKYSLKDRLRILSERFSLSDQEIELLRDGGLKPEQANGMIENVCGLFALPFGLGLNMQRNGKDHVVPMVVEEPSIVAAISSASKLVRAGGGFETDADRPILTGQVQIEGIDDLEAARAAILAASAELLERANRPHPRLVERGGGACGLSCHIVAGGGLDGTSVLVVHVHIDCRDAMGANLVNTSVESLSARIEELSGGKVLLRILTNLCDQRKVRARCTVPFDALGAKGFEGLVVARGIESASRFAENDPYRAATHNKGTLNGIDAVALATGNDWRAIEAAAHAWAARDGRYTALATWRRDESARVLRGKLELPLAVGTVGGATKVHPLAQLALKLLRVDGAQELAEVMAAVGLAQNLAALRALTTEGIQRGHMALHARNLAVAVGAADDEIDLLAGLLVQAGEVKQTKAVELLATVRQKRLADTRSMRVPSKADLDGIPEEVVAKNHPDAQA